MTNPSARPRSGLATIIRVVSAAAVIGSSVAVTALTVDNGDRVAVVVPQAQVAPAPVAPPAGNAETAPAPAAPPAVGTPAPAASVPLGGGVGAGAVPIGTAPVSTVPLPTAAPGAGPAGAVPLGAVAPGTGSPFGATIQVTQPPCPLGWPAPEKQGGLASLIGLAPLAGPFSSEAFALASVYQPMLRLAGPILAEIAPVITHYQPQIDPIIQNVQAVEAVVLQAILPYYGPYRDQLIAAEGDVAKALAPVLERAYATESASCLVAWQGQVVEQARGGRIVVPSLARPGTLVELGPQPFAPRTDAPR
ncbi:hypothetical protein OG921_20005 [Aldersonia sp. NBC_00410]|uniref:hypothetical protein n=1 Tax=Aldersonia sp. NBC_00410 TaxID=2975954 RepID=UPI002256FC20|nr:hypothetical protein [Aldersonia sp. NBC_00410]MCX5045457.1 hypothetical protein [Aldersonia sp. NBC_00410]